MDAENTSPNSDFLSRKLKTVWNRKAHKKSVRSHVYIFQSHREKISEMIRNGEIQSASGLIRQLLDNFFAQKNSEDKGANR